MVSALHCPTIYLLDITNDCALGLQNQALSSPDGRVYLLVQGDGNLVLYSAQVANLFGQSFASAIFATRTWRHARPLLPGHAAGMTAAYLLVIPAPNLNAGCAWHVSPALASSSIAHLCCCAAGLQPGIAERGQPEHLPVWDSQPGDWAMPARGIWRRRRRVCCHRLQQCHALLAGRIQPPGDCARDPAIQRSSHTGQPDLRRVLCASMVQSCQ